MSAEILDLLGTWVRVRSLRSRLLGWYDANRRDLPWRRDPDPYRVLVSEFMLQQTRVEVVAPYFESWTARWPDLRSLAAAHEDEVLAAWSGLGYYRRARALHAIARHVVAQFEGALPQDPAALRELPGIGPYTAAAVASIAFGRAAAVVDGNVERVVVRLLADLRSPGAARRRTVEEAARRLVTGFPEDDPTEGIPLEALRPGDFNQAMMELGATVCVPRNPRCIVCPLRRSCGGHASGRAEELPVRRERRPGRDVTLHCLLVRAGDRFLVERRPEGTLLSGLWQLPTTDEGGDPEGLAVRVASHLGLESPPVTPAEPVRVVRHTITDRRIACRVYEVVLDDAAAPDAGAGAQWVRRADLRDLGVSSLTRKSLG